MPFAPQNVCKIFFIFATQAALGKTGPTSGGGQFTPGEPMWVTRSMRPREESSSPEPKFRAFWGPEHEGTVLDRTAKGCDWIQTGKGRSVHGQGRMPLVHNAQCIPPPPSGLSLLELLHESLGKTTTVAPKDWGWGKPKPPCPCPKTPPRLNQNANNTRIRFKNPF